MSKRKILFVEDGDTAAVDIKQRLESFGYEVAATRFSSENAVDEVETHSPGIVIMDVKLQGKLDGIAAAKTIRSKYNLPIVFLTADADEKTIDQAKMVEPSAYILKPFEDSSLKAAIELSLYKHQMEMALRENSLWLATTLKNISDALIACDAQERILFMNPIAESLLGQKQGDIAGEAISNILQLLDVKTRQELDPSSELVAMPGETLRSDHRCILRCSNGDETHIDCYVCPLINDDGNSMGSVYVLHDMTSYKKLEDQLKASALYDALTGLPNRKLFLEHLDHSIKQLSRREQYRFAVLFIDLDGFKAVNDTFGHSAGDMLLMEVAGRFNSTIRPSDTLARLGGDEFVILLDNIKDFSDSIVVTNRLYKELDKPIDIDGDDVFVSASLGIALSNSEYNKADEILRDADMAMYRAKMAGKGRYEIFDDEMRERVQNTLLWENELRDAIEKQNFCVYYQPIMNIKERKPVAFEAFLRWKQKTSISPIEIINIAEKVNMISEIDQWLISSVCSHINEWNEKCPFSRNIIFHVNLAAKDFSPEANLVTAFQRMLSDNSIEANRFCFEITEPIVLNDYDRIRKQISELRDLNAKVELDNFGTGYSSLSYLHKLPIDGLKIDRTFIQSLTTDAQSMSIVESIIGVANKLGLHTVAEGVENEAQLDCLISAGCNYAQGYYFSEPLSESRMQELLE
jgi:diguanylate cyclase (GGDEF)-like protein/PAS domain S-box-containing protein